MFYNGRMIAQHIFLHKVKVQCKRLNLIFIKSLCHINMDKYVCKSKRKHEVNSDDTENDNTKCKQIRKTTRDVRWKQIIGENLNCDYAVLYTKDEADELLKECEESLEYNTGKLAQVQVFGKWHEIPRKQVAHGDPGLSYRFSNNTVPSKPWTPLLEKIRDNISEVTGYQFNFVLINRYKDGDDHMGEHRDDEADLERGYPIASLSLGQPRDFIFKHADSRGKNAKRKIDPVKIELQHGSLLMMKHPTNTYWYHSLPQRKKMLESPDKYDIQENGDMNL